MPDYPTIAKELSASDPVLKRIIKEAGPCQLKPKPPYRAIVGSVVSQLLSIQAAKTIFDRMMDVLDGELKPEKLAKAKPGHLHAAGLSKAKTATLIDISKQVASGQLDFRKIKKMSDDEVRKELMAIKGIGNWTAEMMLIFSFNRLDVLPTGDVGVQRAMMLNYGMKTYPKPRTMLRLAKPWEPYRSVGTWYMYESLHLGIAGT